MRDISNIWPLGGRFLPVLILVAAMGSVTAESNPGCAPIASQRAQVAAVMDAQTVQLDGGAQVRLIGALAPETPPWWKEAKPWPPLEAARRALENLAMSKEIELRFASGEDERDRHGRLLAQAYVRTGNETIWVQGHLVGEGYALAYSFPGHRACARRLQRFEHAARAARKGLWRRGSFTILPAAQPAQVSKRRGRYQLVEGRVVSVGNTSRWTFLNFADDWKADFTVAIRAGDRRIFEGSDVALVSLQNKRVRVRGWIERWNGPVVKATHPEQIELLAD